MYTLHMYTEYVAFEKVLESMIFFFTFIIPVNVLLLLFLRNFLKTRKGNGKCVIIEYMYIFVCNEEQYLSSTVS